MKIVLAYSGGLDTTAVVARYRDEGHDVVCVYGELGQPDERERAQHRAEAAGAVAYEYVDLRDEFADDFVARALKANARYEGRYPLVSALSRPVIAKALVAAARKHDADAVAHGCTGKGNDQVRFEVSLRALAPDLEVLAPIRDWAMTRPESLALLAAKGIEVDATTSSPYSVDENVCGRACECGVLEDVWQAPPADAYTWTVDPSTAPSEPTDITITFVDGLPIELDGHKLALVDIVARLNEIGGRYGYGRLDMIENRRIGIKSREVYECPGALALIEAHRNLEDLCLDRDVAHFKSTLETRWADLVYDGLWFSPLRAALDAFVDTTQEGLDGDVIMRFAPGSCFCIGRRSPVALYDCSLATYDADDAFNHADSEGFVRLWGLPAQTWAKVRGAK